MRARSPAKNTTKTAFSCFSPVLGSCTRPHRGALEEHVAARGPEQQPLEGRQLLLHDKQHKIGRLRIFPPD